MRDKDLYARILGIGPPWFVREVTLELEAGDVTVHLGYDASAPLTCPLCGKAAPGYDTRHRRWRHLDTCQYRTVIDAEVPRIQCGEHGVHQISLPWAEPGSRFTALFEALAIDWMQEASLTGVCRLLGISWDEAAGIQARAVRRGLARRALKPPTRIGVDETSFQKRHEYVTVVSDPEQGCVLHVGDDRGRASLEGFYALLSAPQRAGIATVCMDMWSPYIAATEAWIPGAADKIAFDKFHVAKHLGDAVNHVRAREHRALLAQGRRDLQGTRRLWLSNPLHLSAHAWADLKALRRMTLRTAEAWAIKELAMSLWGYKTRSWARKAWRRCIAWARQTGLRPVIKVANLLETNLEGIVNAVVLQVTNGSAEAINARIQWIKKKACGYRNRERFRQAIYFHLGGLDLYPPSAGRP